MENSWICSFAACENAWGGEKNGMSKSYKGFSSAAGLIYTVLPVCCLVFGSIFIYDMSVKNRVNKTVNEIVISDESIRNHFTQPFKELDNSKLILNDILALGAEVSEKDYTITNHFGGQTVFAEALNTNAEKLLYLSLLKDPQKYHEVYDGVTAYIVSYNGLNLRECMLLSQVEWKKRFSNFMGMEISRSTPEIEDNGTYKLKTQLLSDKDIYSAPTNDTGYLFKDSLTSQMAKAACQCSYWDNLCMVALKFRK